MKTIILVAISIMLVGCWGADREIDATFKSYCDNSVNKGANLELNVFICENEKYRKAVVAEYEWFHSEADIERFFYRVFGVLVIVLSISIPIVTQSSLQNKDMIVTYAAVLIAIGTSLSAFFSWGENWAQYRSAEYEYRSEIRKWDMAISKVVHSDLDFPEKIDQVHKNTRSLIRTANDINMRANKQFFESNGNALDSYLEK